METNPLYGRGLWDIRIWIGLGLAFVFLNSFNDCGPKSRFWFAELILYALMIAGLWANHKHDFRKKMRIPSRLAPLAYVCLTWFFGMVYETGLTVNGQGIGGLHAQTIPSFILAQGDYITIAIVSYTLIRTLRLSFREMFFVAGGKSLTEGLIFTGVLTALIVSPTFYLSPILLGYYTLAYGSFIALPLLFIDEKLLWKKGEPGKQHCTVFFWILGFVLAMPIRVFWGLVYSPIVVDLFNLPPNVGWNVGDRVFGPRAIAPCCVFSVSRKLPSQRHKVHVIDTSSIKNNIERAKLIQTITPRYLHQSVYKNTTQNVFVTYCRDYKPGEVPLANILECKDCGIKHQRVGCGLEEKGKSDLASRLYYEGKRERPSDRPYLIGADLVLSGWHVNCPERRFFRADYQPILRENEIVYFNESVFDLPEKIVWRQTSDRIRAAIIGPRWFANTLQAGILLDDAYDLRYVLGLLNSRFLNFIYTESVKETGRVFPQVKLAKVRNLPFRTIKFADSAESSRHQQMVSLVDRVIALYASRQHAKTSHEQTALRRQAEATEREIDRLVYELYGLTESEIRIVEESIP